MIPVMVAAGFVEREQVAQAGPGPKLSGPFEAALFLPARALHRAAPDRPAAPGHGPVVHPRGVAGKVVLLPHQKFSRRPAPFLQPRDFSQHRALAPVAQLVPAGFDPLRESGLDFAAQPPAHLVCCFPSSLPGFQPDGKLGPPSPRPGRWRRRGRARCPLERGCVRLGARAAHAFVSALEPLMEPTRLTARRARMCKSELEHPEDHE